MPTFCPVSPTFSSFVVLGGKMSKEPKSKEFVSSDSEEEEMEHRRPSALERSSEVVGRQSGDAGLIKLYKFGLDFKFL